MTFRISDGRLLVNNFWKIFYRLRNPTGTNGNLCPICGWVGTYGNPYVRKFGRKFLQPLPHATPRPRVWVPPGVAPEKNSLVTGVCACARVRVCACARVRVCVITLLRMSVDMCGDSLILVAVCRSRGPSELR